MEQLFHHTPKSKEQLNFLKLSDLAHAYCETPVDLSNFTMGGKFFEAITFLCTIKGIFLTKPNKSSGAVILQRLDYV